MGKYQESKKVALSYFDALEKAEPEQVIQVFREYMTEDYKRQGGCGGGVLDTSKKGSPPYAEETGYLYRRYK